MNQNSLRKVFVKSQQWYQQDAAERIANLTTTSIEMLLESKGSKAKLSDSEERKIIQDFNIIFSQQLLDKNVQSVSILIPHGNAIIAIDDGKQLYDYLFGETKKIQSSDSKHAEAIRLFSIGTGYASQNRTNLHCCGAGTGIFMSLFRSFRGENLSVQSI